VRNLKGICKDGTSPDERLLRGFYGRVTRHEWAVEERQHMSVVHEGWLSKASSKLVGGSARRLYAVLSTRALFFYRDADDTDPAAYLRLEGLAARAALLKGASRAFELYATTPPGEAAKDSVDGRMVKLSHSSDGPRKTISRHTSFVFTAPTDAEAVRWTEAVRSYTMDVPGETLIVESALVQWSRSTTASGDCRGLRTRSPACMPTC
jgi:hypothetical protein